MMFSRFRVSLCLATGIFGSLSGSPGIAQAEPVRSGIIPCHSAPCLLPETPPGLRNTHTPLWGDPTLLPGAEGKKVLVVGDSWGMAAAAGISTVLDGKGQVTNAAKGGCGIRVQHKTGSAACPKWEVEWPSLMAKVRPDAVLMSVQMDTMEQATDPGGKPVTILDDKARRKFVTSLDKAVRILTRNRTPVYLLGWPGAHNPGSVTVTYSGILLEFSKKYPGVHYLDTHHQLCNDLNQCPKEISGIPVYGPSHLSKQSEARIGNWILNSMFHKK
ncbi:SGNH hydrolase domain-containing protein [Streptomyces sp. NPDC048479]|uniref:SGNH hydrolase domain-containing protein n=1 Tax=Streptomyces sp. NPDC048479 TaxID=3154725 RepID=UPI003445F2B3